MRDEVLRQFTLGGTALSILASSNCFLIENDLSEDQPSWTGGEDSDPVLRKESWKISWEARVQPGLLAMKTVPPSTLMRIPEVRAALPKIQAASFNRQRQLVLLEFALFEGYWPAKLDDVEYRKLFLVTEFHQEYMATLAKDLGFPGGLALELRKETERLWGELCPPDFQPPSPELAEWPMTAFGRCLAAPFVQGSSRLLCRPGFQEDPNALVDSALASIGVGIGEARNGEEGGRVGALAAGGILLDEENTHSWECFERWPLESQVMIVAKLLTFTRHFLGDPDQLQLRHDMASRIHGLRETVGMLLEQTTDHAQRRKRQTTQALLAGLEKAIRF